MSITIGTFLFVGILLFNYEVYKLARAVILFPASLVLSVAFEFAVEASIGKPNMKRILAFDIDEEKESHQNGN